MHFIEYSICAANFEMAQQPYRQLRVSLSRLTEEELQQYQSEGNNLYCLIFTLVYVYLFIKRNCIKINE